MTVFTTTAVTSGTYCFVQDGDYNKEVPAQYTEDINHPVTCHQTEFLTRGQYLCHRCQRNQLLKVKQLATFEPLNEVGV